MSHMSFPGKSTVQRKWYMFSDINNIVLNSVTLAEHKRKRKPQWLLTCPQNNKKNLLYLDICGIIALELMICWRWWNWIIIKAAVYKIENTDRVISLVNVVINSKGLKSKAPLRDVSHQWTLLCATYKIWCLGWPLKEQLVEAWTPALPRGQSNHDDKIYV